MTLGNGFREKRAFSRFQVCIHATLIHPNLYIEAETNDISASGVGIITERQFAPGTELKICLHMDDNGQEIYLKGKAIWIIPLDSGNYRVGVKLDGVNLKPIPLVLRFLNSHQS